MPVYDDEKQKLKEEPGSHDSLGVHPERAEAEAADLQKQLDAPAIADGERNAGKPKEADKASKEESGKLGRGFQDEEEQGKKKKKKKFWTRRKAAAGIVSLTVASGVGIGGFSVIQGPLQFLQIGNYLSKFHFSSNHNFMDNRSGKLIKHAWTMNAKERRNMGFIGNKIADKYTAKFRAAGITPEYENRRIKAFVIDTANPRGKVALDQFRQMGIDIDTLPRDGTNVRVDIDKPGVGSARYRRQAISGMMSTLHLTKVSSTLGSRVLKVRAGVDFHPLKNVIRAVDEDIRDYIKKRKDERAHRNKNGVHPSTGRAVTARGSPDAEGNQTNPDSDTTQVADELQEKLAQVDADGSTEQRAANIRRAVGGGVGAAGLLSLVCGVQQVGAIANDLRHAQVILPLIRIAMDMITMSSQIQSGEDFNITELEATKDNLYHPEHGSWLRAASVQHNHNEPVTGPDLPDSVHPTNEIKGSGLFKAVDDFIDEVPGGGGFCAAVTSTVGGWLLTGAGLLLNVSGIGFIVNAAAEGATQLLLHKYLPELIAWLAGDQVDLEAAGPLFGSMVDYGGRLAANDDCMSTGCIGMSQEEELELAVERAEMDRLKLQNQPAFARYFDVQNYDSFASTFARKSLEFNPRSVSSILTIPVNVASMFTGAAQKMLNPSANAVSTYDYGFEAFGFTLDEIDDPRYEDPYFNGEERVEPHLARLNQEYGGCFGATVNPETFKYEVVPAPRYDDIPDKCKDRSNQELTDYRFYLADTRAGLALACYDDLVEDACVEIGLEDTMIGGGNTTLDGDEVGPAPEGGDGWAWPIRLADWPSRAQPVAECDLRYSNGTVHTGIDISVPTGTRIYAAASGRISMSSAAYGALNIETNETDSNGNKLYVNYQHLSRRLVGVGENVAKGQLIGYSGSVGTSSPHLHFGIWTTNRFLGGHMSPGSAQGRETIAQMRHPMSFLPLGEDSRNISECRR